MDLQHGQVRILGIRSQGIKPFDLLQGLYKLGKKTGRFFVQEATVPTFGIELAVTR